MSPNPSQKPGAVPAPGRRPAPPRSWLSVVVDHGRAAYPGECCGLLVRPGNTGLLMAIPLENCWPGPAGFHVAPVDLLRVAVAGRRRADRWVAVYHSHPAAPAILSSVDARLGQALAGVAQVVLAMQDGEVLSVGYFLRHGRHAYRRVDREALEGTLGVPW